MKSMDIADTLLGRLFSTLLRSANFQLDIFQSSHRLQYQQICFPCREPMPTNAIRVFTPGKPISNWDPDSENPKRNFLNILPRPMFLSPSSYSTLPWTTVWVDNPDSLDSIATNNVIHYYIVVWESIFAYPIPLSFWAWWVGIVYKDIGYNYVSDP